MKSQLTKNLLFNVAAGLLAFAFIRYVPVSAAQIFTGLTVVGLGIIVANDYRPRRRLRFVVTPARPVPAKAERRRVSALVAA